VTLELNIHIHFIPSFQLAKPPPLPKWMALIEPFQMELWVAFIATFICSLMFVVFYAAIYPKAEFSSVEFLFFLIGTMVDASQPHTEKLKSDAIRKEIAFCSILQ
jgi:hypothetical protein